jgi:hypothetical protein
MTGGRVLARNVVIRGELFRAGEPVPAHLVAQVPENTWSDYERPTPNPVAGQGEFDVSLFADRQAKQ